MGLFDLFKKQEKPVEISQQNAPAEIENSTNQTEPYYGDLEKTAALQELFAAPQASRNDEWQAAVLANLPAASFQCGNPQVIEGPDGFPYVQLLLPEPGKSFQCYVIDHMKDDFLLEKGFGVAINPSESNPDWVLTYGDILNYQLNKQFYGAVNNLFTVLNDKSHETEVIQEAEEVMVGTPSEYILPEYAKVHLREIFKMHGIVTPKILLMMRKNKANNADIMQDLVFNITEHSFESREHFEYVMRTLGWYLPRHYTIVGMDEKTFENEFLPL